MKVELIVRRGPSYELDIFMTRGDSGVIAIDDIALEYKPVLATADIRSEIATIVFKQAVHPLLQSSRARDYHHHHHDHHARSGESQCEPDSQYTNREPRHS